LKTDRLPAMWTLNLVLAGAAAAVYFLLAGHLTALTGPAVSIGWPVLGLLFAATQVGVIQLRTRSQAHIISVGEVPLILGLMFATPTNLIVGQLAGAGLALVLQRRQGPTQVAFKLATLGLQTTAALVVFHAVIGTSAPISVGGWVGSLLAAATSTVIGSVAIFASLALSRGAIVATRIAQAFGLALAATFTTTNLAIITANGITAGPYLVAPLAVLAALLVVAYRALLAERGRRDGLEFLYRISRITQGPGDFGQMFVDLLEEARTMFSAETAEIVMFGDDDPAHPQLVRTTVGIGAEPERMLSAESVLTRPAIEEAVGPEARIVASGVSATGNSMVARLAGETRTHGVLVAANPPHIASGFKPGQLRLFQTLANHISLTLENGQLERSIVQLKEMEQELSYKAFHDPLTSLANRALFRTRLQESLDDEEPGLAVIFIDLDDFKTVNDTLGHAVGDQLLTIVGARIHQCLAADDLAARLGGDEFAVLVVGVGQSEAARVAARLMAALGQPIEVAGRQVSTQASLGVAMVTRNDRAADDLMRHADLAMYTAKRNGKGCFEFFEPEMSAAVMLRHQLKEDLNRACQNAEFENHYQTMVDLQSGAITAVETLVRWNHPWAGQMSPDDFIPLAEETGSVVAMGRQVLASACRDGAAWRHLVPDLSVSVNISARQLDDDSLMVDLAQMLDETGFPPEALILEITETVSMGDLDAVIERLANLKRLGIRLAMDDFGTGYSSLAQIRRLPIDILKIPKPFVDHIAESQDSLETVRAITALSESLGLVVVAEGIENEEQRRCLADLTCGLGQGYLFGRPLAAHEMTRALATEASRTPGSAPTSASAGMAAAAALRSQPPAGRPRTVGVQ